MVGREMIGLESPTPFATGRYRPPEIIRGQLEALRRRTKRCTIVQRRQQALKIARRRTAFASVRIPRRDDIGRLRDRDAANGAEIGKDACSEAICAVGATLDVVGTDLIIVESIVDGPDAKRRAGLASFAQVAAGGAAEPRAAAQHR